LLLLFIIFAISSFLDNIAAAMIGGSIALVIFRRKVHIGYVAAIVAASNAGGAWSMVGDTTTTMMWMQGVEIGAIAHAFVASFTALLFFGWFAARQQHRYQPHVFVERSENTPIYWKKVLIVLAILVGAIAANFLFDLPAMGVWAALVLGRALSPVPWEAVGQSLKETIILLALVFAASLMPVYDLPPASLQVAFGIGIVSAFFNNIPLTEMCLEEGHFDWGVLAYTIGFGGSMMWFGSSAGVAITSQFNEARNMGKWLKNSWHIPVAYVIGFLALYLILGWNPTNGR
jgi:Na+/H+ antiporter NhaD/arsenite permease-like protein